MVCDLDSDSNINIINKLIECQTLCAFNTLQCNCIQTLQNTSIHCYRLSNTVFADFAQIYATFHCYIKDSPKRLHSSA